MNVSVTITLTVPATRKHWKQMQQVAELLTDARNSVRVSQGTAANRDRLTVIFTVPVARQRDIVDRIGRAFWSIEDYSNSLIRFG